MTALRLAVSVAQSNAGRAFARPEFAYAGCSGDAGHRRQVAVGMGQHQRLDLASA